MAVLPVTEDLVLPLVKRYELRFHIDEVIIIVPLIQIVMLEALLRVHQLRIIAIVQDTIYKVKAGQVYLETYLRVSLGITYFGRGRSPSSSC